MRQLPTATGNGLSNSQLRAKLDRQPQTRWIVKVVQVVAAVVLVGWAAWLIDDSGLRLVGIIFGVSAATALLMHVLSP